MATHITLFGVILGLKPTLLGSLLPMKFYILFMFGLLVSLQLQKLVAENILAFNEGFWIRLAARTDTCKSKDDKARSWTWFSYNISVCVSVIHFSLLLDARSKYFDMIFTSSE